MAVPHCLKYSFAAASIIIASPVLLVLTPFLIFVASLKVLLNLARASRWRPAPYLKLAVAVVEHIVYVVKHIPSMLHVLHYYVLRAAVHDGARINVPFEAYVVEGRRGGGNHGTASRRATPPSDPSSTATSPRSSPVTRASSESPVNASLHGRSMCLLDVYPQTVGSSSRNSKLPGGLCPVIVFVYGGAWGSGNKWMYAKLAAMLRDACGAVVVVPNYPTYPNGTMLDMLECLHRCLVWVSDNIAMYGGDKNNTWLVGHSAGAHLATLLVLRRCIALAQKSPHLTTAAAQARGDDRSPIHPLSMWGHDVLQVPLRSPCVDSDVNFQSTPQVRGVIALAGVFDLRSHLEWEERRCVAEVSTMRGATGGYWDANAPLWLLRHEQFDAEGFVRALPSRGFHFFHDPRDPTVSIEQSVAVQKALIEAGVPEVLAPPVADCSFGHAEIVMGPLKANPRLGIHPTISAILSCMAVE